MKERTRETPLVTVGTVIDQRFKVEAELFDELGQHAYLAKDQKLGGDSIVFPISESDKTALSALAKVEHAHLARVQAVIEVPDGTLVAAERIAGESLVDRLAHLGKKQMVDAVRSSLRLADALSVAHQQGGYHGRIDPKVVILDPMGRTGPVLALGGATPSDRV